MHIVFHLNVCCAERTKILCGRVFLIDPPEVRIQGILPIRHGGAIQLEIRLIVVQLVALLSLLPTLKHAFQMDCLISQRQFKLFRVCLVQFDQLRQQTVLKALLKLAFLGADQKHLRLCICRRKITVSQQIPAEGIDYPNRIGDIDTDNGDFVFIRSVPIEF